MDVKELLTAVRTYANMPAGDGGISNSGIVRFLNSGKDMIARRIIQQDAKHFEVYDDIDLVADQQEYDIPRHFKDGRITLVERRNAAGEVLGKLEYRRFQEKSSLVDPEWPNEGRGGYYYLRGRKIGLHSIPGESVTDGLRVYGIQMPHDMYWGDVPSTGLTTSAFVMSETHVRDSGDLRAGVCHHETNYYVNAIIRVLTGASARGIERTCTAYNSTTRTWTISTVWTTADVDGQEFVILNPVAEMYPDALIGYALQCLAIPANDSNLRVMGKDMMGEWQNLVLSDVQPRHMDESQSMPLPVDDSMDY